MPCGPSSTTTKRGHTIIEMSVAATIFLLMTSILLTLLVQNQKASEKVSNHNDATAEVLIVYEKVRNELRHARVIGNEAPPPAPPAAAPARAGALKYWVARMVNDVPQLTASGQPDWLPGSPSAPEVAYLYSRNGFLVREFPAGTIEPLTRLGPDGRIQFNWDAASHNVSLVGGVGDIDANDVTKNNFQPFMYMMYASNNE